MESAIESLEAQNEGGEDGVVARLPEKLAEQKALRQRVRQAMKDLPSMERPNRYKRPGTHQSDRQGRQVDADSSGDCAKLQCLGNGIACRHR